MQKQLICTQSPRGYEFCITNKHGKNPPAPRGEGTSHSSEPHVIKSFHTIPHPGSGTG